MNCEQYANLIDDLIGDELDEQTAELVNLHAFACEACAFQMETLKSEKEIYARFLFEVEPAADLPEKFLAKLKTEKAAIADASRINKSAVDWKTSILGFLRFYPAFAVAVLLVLGGIGFLKFVPKDDENTVLAIKSESDTAKTTEIMNGNISEIADTNLPVNARDNKKTNSVKSSVNKSENRYSSAKREMRTKVKAVQLKSLNAEEQKVSTFENRNLALEAQISEEERLQRTRAQNLENETAKQVEKVEMLLRSFRNARFNENSEFFDVAYEKEQARRLLKINIQLRQEAEIFGNADTESLLAKVEPLLLDIANLENSFLPDKVLDIKERVKSQNIIASLQVYK